MLKKERPGIIIIDGMEAYMKKIISLTIAVIILISAFCGCSLEGKMYKKKTGEVTVFQLAPEKDSLMMSYVIKTPNDKIVVIDGGIDGTGLSADPYLPSAIRSILGLPEDGAFEVEAWFLTHAHRDHFNELSKMLGRYTRQETYKINNFYFDFPEMKKEWSTRGAESDYQLVEMQDLQYGLNNYYQELGETIPADAKNEDGSELTGAQRRRYHYDRLNGATVNENTVKDGLTITVDGVDFNVLQTWSKNDQVVNSNSMVIRMCYKEHSILFLGDTYGDSGDRLLRTYGADALKSDYVQMSHHGQAGANQNFYLSIGADKSKRLWPTPAWVWDTSNNNLQTGTTRSWLGLPESAADFDKDAHPDDYVMGLYDCYPENPHELSSWTAKVLKEQTVAEWK